jgi:hypothetical protein
MCEKFIHEYAEKVCKCGEVFCFSCCKDTNVHEGGKYEPSFMLCPKCGADFYETEAAKPNFII